MEGLIPFLARDILGFSFALTAAWKLTHWQVYTISFRYLRPQFMRAVESPARYALVGAELACCCLLFSQEWITGGAQEIGPLFALALLGVFTASVVSQSSVSDCGCWSSPAVELKNRDTRGLLLIRNAVLLAVCGVAIVPGHPPRSVIVALSSLAFAAVVAPVLLELPQVIPVTRYHGGIPADRSSRHAEHLGEASP